MLGVVLVCVSFQVAEAVAVRFSETENVMSCHVYCCGRVSSCHVVPSYLMLCHVTGCVVMSV